MHVGMWGLAAIVIVIASWLMYRTWVDLLPGFHWLSWGSFAPGLVETLAYGVFFGLVFAPLYNLSPVKVWRHAS